MAAGLPNVKAYDSTVVRVASPMASNAAFWSKSATSTGFGGGSNSTSATFNLDLSKGNPIYGNADTVQPAAIKLQFVIKY